MVATQTDMFDDYGATSLDPTHDEIRKRLHAMLTTARAAARMPWDARRARVNALLFHNMANWLPEHERDSLRAAFTRELERLRAAG